MRNQLTNEEIIYFLADYKNKLNGAELPFLSITGGEPLLRKNFISLMTEIHKLGYKWGMTSNGLLIDNEMAIKLKEAGMRTIAISLDGMRETHDWFRQTTGSFDRTVESIKILIKTGFDNVMVTTVFHSCNIHEFKDIYNLMLELKVDTWRPVNMDPIGRGKNSRLLLNKDEIKILIKNIIEYRKKEQS